MFSFFLLRRSDDDSALAPNKVQTKIYEEQLVQVVSPGEEIDFDNIIEHDDVENFNLDFGFFENTQVASTSSSALAKTAVTTTVTTTTTTSAKDKKFTSTWSRYSPALLKNKKKSMFYVHQNEVAIDQINVLNDLKQKLLEQQFNQAKIEHEQKVKCSQLEHEKRLEVMTKEHDLKMKILAAELKSKEN